MDIAQSVTQYLTDFADQAVVLPLTLCVFLGLLLAGWRRGAAAWLVCICGVLGVMLVLKLFFAACGHLIDPALVRSPSGHTAAAEVAYGGIAALLLRQRYGVAGAVAGALLFAVLAGTTRLLLGVHTLAEVSIGTLVGLGGILAMIAAAGPFPPGLRWRRTIAAMLVVVFALHGLRLGAEPVIDRLARYYFWPLSVCAVAQARS